MKADTSCHNIHSFQRILILVLLGIFAVIVLPGRLLSSSMHHAFATLLRLLFLITVHTLRKPHPLSHAPHKHIRPFIHRPPVAPDNYFVELADLLCDLDFLGQLVLHLLHFVVAKRLSSFAGVRGPLWRKFVRDAKDCPSVRGRKRQGGAVQVAAAEVDVFCSWKIVSLCAC